MVVSPVTAAPAVRKKTSRVFAVAHDMATRLAEYQPRWLHDRRHRLHEGASQFFGPG